MAAPPLLPRLLLLACALLLGATACSSSGGPSPKARKRNVLLSTQYDDARVGKEASRDVASEIGLFGDAALDAYVDELGRKLLRGVPRRGFQYEFRVVDQTEPNAFALPGGYIFVSRGLLALVDTEDELANVLGHEIIHSARRHAAAQQEIARRGGARLGGWFAAGQMAAYGRDMERTADREGQRLAAAAGFDPMGMSTFLRKLGKWEQLHAGYSRQRGFFDTHPGSTERAASNATRAREIRWRRDPARGDPRSSYLKRIEGLAVGPRPETGVFQGDRFLHPTLDFQIRFPPGWRTSNTNRAVGALAPKGDAMITLMADLPAGAPEEVAQGFVEKTQAEAPVTVKASKPVKIGRLDAWRMQLEGGGGGGTLSALITFVPRPESTWRISCVTPSFAADRYRGRMLSATRSFRPLTAAERRSVRTTRLRLVKARAGEDLVALGRRTQNSWDPARTAVFNAVLPDHRFRGGELVKVGRTEGYTPGG